MAFPSAVPELSGPGVRLRAMTEADVPAWFERASDPETAALTGDPVPESVDVCYEWLELHRRRFRERAAIRWAIVPDGAAGSVGSIGLSIVAPTEGTAELGAAVAPAHRYRGLGTGAARLVIDYAFGPLELTEIRADLLDTNLASRRVLEKLGFEFVRIIEQYRRTPTGIREGHLYRRRRNSADRA